MAGGIDFFRGSKYNKKQSVNFSGRSFPDAVMIWKGKKTMKKCFALFFVLVEVCFFLMYYGQSVTDVTGTLFSQELNNPSVHWIDPLAPKTEGAAASSAASREPEEPQYGRVTQFLREISEKQDRLKKQLTEKMPYYHAAVTASRYWDRLSGKNATTAVAGMFDERDSYTEATLELANGAFALAYSKTEEIDEVVDHNIAQTLTLAEQLKQQGIAFLFMEVPTRVGLSHNDPGYQKYIGVFEDATPEYETYVRRHLEQAGIPMVDILEQYPDMREHPETYYFKTDHHWKPETGLLACNVLGQELNARYGYSIDTGVFDLANYDDSVTLQWIGSAGRKVTRAYCDLEPITILQPLYDTNFTVKHSFNDNTIVGSMTETLYYRKMTQQQDMFSFSAYATYAYGDPGMMEIENNNIQDGKRLLILKKSFADVMIPFLAATVDHVDVLDLRHYTGSLQAYIEKTQPDTVVMIYGSSAFIQNDDAFDFR